MSSFGKVVVLTGIAAVFVSTMIITHKPKPKSVDKVLYLSYGEYQVAVKPTCDSSGYVRVPVGRYVRPLLDKQGDKIKCEDF